MLTNNCSVLLVDDEAFSRMLVGDCIRKIPNIRLAASLTNGFSAKQYLLENPVDIILADIRMPLMDGLELAEFVKEFDPRCLVVIISAYGEFEYAQKAIQSGVTDYLLKPVQLDQIVATIHKNMNRIQARRNQLLTQKYNPEKEIEDKIIALFKYNSKFDGWKQKLKEQMGKKNILLRLQTNDKTEGRSEENSFFYKKVLQSILPGWKILRIRHELGQYEYLLILSDEQSHRLLKNIEEYLKFVLDQEVDIAVLQEVKLPEELEAFYNHKDEKCRAKEIEIALRYIEEHLSEDLSRDEVAEQVFLSPSYFSRLFKSEVGVGFGDYLLNLRIKRARRLFAKGKKVYEVASLVGFRDEKYFSAVFEKHTGYLPSEYRRALLNGNLPEESSV